MKRCASCGNENLDMAKFCDSCGSHLETAPAAAAPPPPMAPAYPPEAPQPAVPASARAVLKAEVSGREFALDPNREAIMGRGDRARNLIPDIELNDSGALAQGVSRLHAKVIHRDGCYYLIDLNSTNSTYINGSKMIPQQPYSLQQGDRVELGNFRLAFYLST